jgi:hypothetical protein
MEEINNRRKGRIFIRFDSDMKTKFDIEHERLVEDKSKIRSR